MEVLQSSDHLCGPPLGPLQQLSVLVLRAPELDTILQMVSHESRVEGQNHLPWPAGQASLDGSQDTVGFLGCEHTLPACIESFIDTPKSFSSELFSSHSPLNQYLCLRLPQLRSMTLHLALLNLHLRLARAHLSSLSISLWMASHIINMQFQLWFMLVAGSKVVFAALKATDLCADYS